MLRNLQPGAVALPVCGGPWRAWGRLLQGSMKPKDFHPNPKTPWASLINRKEGSGIKPHWGHRVLQHETPAVIFKSKIYLRCPWWVSINDFIASQPMSMSLGSTYKHFFDCLDLQAELVVFYKKHHFYFKKKKRLTEKL